MPPRTLSEPLAHLSSDIGLEKINAVLPDCPPGMPAKLRMLLGASADPDAVLLYLGRLRQAHPEAFERFSKGENALPSLVAVLAHSRFLAEEILQQPEWLEQILESPDLYRCRTSEQLARRFEDFLGPDSGVPAALSLALFRRQQLLRIALRDVMGLGTLSEATEEISNLADAILDVTYRRIRADLVRRYGVPRYQDENGLTQECGFSVIALGKLGGRELNYSSDIDLMFIYSANGETDGGNSISNREFFKKVANQYTDLLCTYTAEGLCYRVDLRLRPDGRLGEVCLSLDGAKQYYSTRARDWELQMLIKARVAAGEPGPGEALLQFVEPRIYSTTLDFNAVESVSETRARIHEKYAARRGPNEGLDVKLARGGIRDIEFLVQCLQRLHGGREPWVRHGGTLLALSRLRDKELLSEPEYSRLAASYQFLRHLEHRLQLLDDRQTHTLPSTPEDLDVLSRRMPVSELGRMPSGAKLLHQLNGHLEDVQETYERVIHSQQPLYYGGAPAAGFPRILTAPEAGEDQPANGAPQRATLAGDALAPSSNLIRFLDQRAPQLAAAIAANPPRRSFRAFEHFLESIYSAPAQLDLLNAQPQLAADAVNLFENSPHFAELLARHPELVEELAHIRDGVAPHYGDLHALLGDVTLLRRFYHREVLRIQSESICLGAPIFTTLERMSNLADAVIAAAYRMAIEQVRESHPPSDSGYEPKQRMMVIAMGRLGMREFDLGSDADLNFVLPDADASEMHFWNRVANRLIDVLSAYTGEGVMFAVDTRLRPNGREGQLVQTVHGYKEYLAKTAEAWEGITYMKSRAIAGNVEAATDFLGELQEVDWRRYGQSGRSRTDLRNMRNRLEKEQGQSNPLKAGYGGYYDIDFALMYLRLKSAGIFFKCLNTPERIDIIEKMGHLERDDARFLLDAATFYRALDHGLRVYSGHAEGRLPESEKHLEVLTSLVQRWTPPTLHGKPLPQQLQQIQNGTREYFRRLFG